MLTFILVRRSYLNKNTIFPDMIIDEIVNGNFIKILCVIMQIVYTVLYTKSTSYLKQSYKPTVYTEL